MHRLKWLGTVEDRCLSFSPYAAAKLLLFDFDMTFDNRSKPDAGLHDRTPDIATPDSHAVEQNLHSDCLNNFQN
jgi:hypothetical protein